MLLSETIYKKWIPRGILAASLFWANSASAKCGGVDYSWGADALAKQHDFVVTMMLYVLYMIYAVASIVVIYASLQIYIKMNTGEDGVKKGDHDGRRCLPVPDWRVNCVPGFLRI